jgi:hypothetical protein
MILGRPEKMNIEMRLSKQRKHLGVGELRVSLCISQIWQ